MATAPVQEPVVTGRVNTGPLILSSPPEVSGAIKGDLVAGSGSGFFALLPPGPDGTVVTADSTQQLGLKYAVPVAPVPWRFDVTTYGAKGDGTTDDTAAIQAAVNAAFAYANAHSNYAEIYFPVPATWYAINGPLQTGANLGNAQITLPVVPGNPSPTGVKTTLAFIGQRDVSATLHWHQNVRQVSGVTLKSNSDTAYDSVNGEASIIGGPTPQQGYGTSATNFSNIMVYWDGIQLMGPNTTNGVGGLDLRGVAAAGGGSFSYMVDAHPVGAPGIAGGSGSGSYFGLATPNNGNNDISFWNSITVYGMTYGVVLGEHTHVNSLRVVYCFDAIAVSGTFYGAGALHGVSIANASVESVTSGGNHLILVGQGAKVHIYLDVEDSTVTITDQGLAAPSTGNVWLTGGAWSTLNLPSSVSNVTIHDTTRPPGHVAAPAVPATTVALQNTFARAAAVTVTGATVTAIAVDGTATGAVGASTGTTVMVPAGKNIALTYATGTPTWVWTLI